MKTFVGLAASAVIAASTLAGCGGSGDYCDSLEAAEAEFGSLDDGDFAEFDAALNTFRDLADEAPSEVEEQWQTLVGAIDDLEAAFEEAGLSFSDLDGLGAGELPEDVDEEALTEALASLEDLDEEALTQAGEEIQEHGESECDVTFPE